MPVTMFTFTVITATLHLIRTACPGMVLTMADMIFTWTTLVGLVAISAWLVLATITIRTGTEAWATQLIAIATGIRMWAMAIIITA